MRFFKYLILLFFYTTNTQASWTVGSSSGNTPESACQSHATITKNVYSEVIKQSPTSYLCITTHPNNPNSGYTSYISYVETLCPSATQKTLSVPRNSGSYTCVSQCQYAIQGCVQVDFQVGNPDGGDRTKMTCNAISTGKECGGGSSGGGSGTGTGTGTGSGTGTGTGTGSGTGNSGSNSNNDGSNAATNSATSNTTNNSTSTSNSTTTTTNNTSTSTTTTTTNTTNNNTTNTSMDLSSLENTIGNASDNLGSKLDDVIKAIKDKATGGDSDGGGDGEKTDLTATNAKLDAISKNGTDLNNFLNEGKDSSLPDGEQVSLPERVLQKQDFSETKFGTSAQCPSASTLSLNVMGKTTSVTFDYTQWCYYLALIGQMILIGAYLLGARIVTRST